MISEFPVLLAPTWKYNRESFMSLRCGRRTSVVCSTCASLLTVCPTCNDYRRCAYVNLQLPRFKPLLFKVELTEEAKAHVAGFQAVGNLAVLAMRETKEKEEADSVLVRSQSIAKG